MRCREVPEADSGGLHAPRPMGHRTRYAVGPDELYRLPASGRAGVDGYEAIAEHARLRGIDWFASPWDIESVDFLEAFDPPAHKVASASLTDDELLRRLRSTRRTIILSTGMSTMRQIRTRSKCWAAKRSALPRHEHVSRQDSRTQSSDDPHAAGRVSQRANRLLRP